MSWDFIHWSKPCNCSSTFRSATEVQVSRRYGQSQMAEPEISNFINFTLIWAPGSAMFYQNCSTACTDSRTHALATHSPPKSIICAEYWFYLKAMAPLPLSGPTLLTCNSTHFPLFTTFFFVPFSLWPFHLRFSFPLLPCLLFLLAPPYKETISRQDQISKSLNIFHLFIYPTPPASSVLSRFFNQATVFDTWKFTATRR